MAAASIPSNGSVQLPVPSSIEPGHYHQQNGGTFPSSPFTAPPGGRSPPAKNAIRLVHDRLRRQSYDVRVLNPNGTIAPNHLRPQRTASARLNPSFTSPSLASTLSIGSLTAKRRASHTVSFGFASAGFYVRRGPDDEEWLEEFEFECERPSTSQSVNEEEECGCDVPAIVAATDEEKEGAESAAISISRNGGMPSHQPAHQYRSRNLARNSQPMALFLLRHADHRILPVYCYRPQGAQADQFIHQSLTERNREAIQRFLEKEHPEEGECYLWVLDDVTMKTTVLSLTLLQNHFKSEHIRRVKWRHLSMDKVSIYRYSLPVITTKFRLRVAHFLARHYRCCILGVWCLVILCISIGIVLSVVFGSAPGAQKMPPNAVPIQPVVHQRSGGFMEEAMEMEQASSRTDGPSPLADRKPPDSVSSQHISAMNTLHGLKRRRRRRK